MSDGRKSCLGFIFLIASLSLAIFALIAGGIGELINRLGGETFGLDLTSGAFVGAVAFVLFLILAVYMFFTIRNFAWFPAIAAGIYTVLPDIFLGPVDDVVVLILGGVISGLLAWRQEKTGKGQVVDLGE